MNIDPEALRLTPEEVVAVWEGRENAHARHLAVRDAQLHKALWGLTVELQNSDDPEANHIGDWLVDKLTDAGIPRP